MIYYKHYKKKYALSILLLFTAFIPKKNKFENLIFIIFKILKDF